jgi:uroporphyrin-III C-methyltransferase/precorrin-2 dehydrogenase/sirohydrochlorin ferrochelatase
VPELARRVEQDDGILWFERKFADEDLLDVRLAIAATDDREVNRHIAALAKAAKVPVNVADQPEDCSFIMPSVIDRSPVVVAVSTGTASPVLARMIRARLESLVPAGYGRLAELCARYRDRVKDASTASATVAGSGTGYSRAASPSASFPGHLDEADAAMERELAAGGNPRARRGLSGRRRPRRPGPADLPRAAADAAGGRGRLRPPGRQAHHRYGAPRRRAHLRRQAAQPAHHAPGGDQRPARALAKEGHRVLRLKGGDPFIFGRGGEEIDTLAAEGIPFQVVPGITAANGCACYGGIPLTHRDYAQSVTFVTGHLKDGTINLNWRQLAEPNQTIVFYMGLVGLPVIVDKLIEHGVPPDMPIALVQQGTTHMQKVYAGTLGSILARVEADPPEPPTLIIVGEVVNLRDKLGWFHTIPDREQGATTPLLPGD